jgi:hypothetical protein
MSAQNDNTAPKGLRGWWASPPRSGMQRLIPPWEYRHLRAWAGVRIASGVALTGLGVVTLSFGGNDRKTYGWTAFWLALAAIAFAAGYWEMTIARDRAFPDQRLCRSSIDAGALAEILGQADHELTGQPADVEPLVFTPNSHATLVAV